MQFIELLFRLGVVFAIFSFLWGLIQFVLTLLRGMRDKTIAEEYLLKSVQYLFLADVTFLFCLTSVEEQELGIQEVLMTGMILLLYFLGKLQNSQSRMKLLNMNFGGLPIKMARPLFHLPTEIGVILLSMALFVLFVFFPDWARNPISNWFYESILNIEDTPVFGFVFKVIGFFVLLGILFRLLNGLSFLLSGKPMVSVNRGFNSGKKESEEDDFDPFEEVDDDER
ncbi:MAG: hypothetical protein EP338_03630 [Bacteroidetes bacterium]|nr:MAG: hypothetical protein EP338_03630 [Bacteroidota bacterium]